MSEIQQYVSYVALVQGVGQSEGSLIVSRILDPLVCAHIALYSVMPGMARLLPVTQTTEPVQRSRVSHTLQGSATYSCVFPV